MRNVFSLNFIITVFTAFFLSTGIISAEPDTNTASASNNQVKPERPKFKAGEFIINHVTDKYEWHITGSEENPISIPLPVILYSKDKGLSVFLSSKFEHGKASYEGYKLNEGHLEREDGAAFYDFSITKAVACILLVSFLILIIFISVARSYARRQGMAPKGLQSLLEPLILFVRDDIAKGSIGAKHYMRFMPLLLTLFFFIFIANFIGLIPSFPGVMGNISVTLTLAAIILVITLFIGNKHYCGTYFMDARSTCLGKNIFVDSY